MAYHLLPHSHGKKGNHRNLFRKQPAAGFEPATWRRVGMESENISATFPLDHADAVGLEVSKPIPRVHVIRRCDYHPSFRFKMQGFSGSSGF